MMRNLHPFILILSTALSFPLAAENGSVFPNQPHPWDRKKLQAVPAIEWGETKEGVQALYYAGPTFGGKATKVFALLGRPAGSDGKKSAYPGIVLVHGGGGRAFPDWVKHWTARGYFALAMDTAGKGPDGQPQPDGGPGQGDEEKFRKFELAEVGEMWSYHAVSAVVSGVSVLSAQPEVDPKRVALTGISWGGYLTTLVAGLDDRLAAVVPVYGCGFLGDNGYWKDKSLAALPTGQREAWLRYFDPSRYVKDAKCPMLFLNGTNDFAYPLDSYRKTVELVPREFRNLSVQVRMPHGHYWNFPEVDAFVDAAVNAGKPLARCGDVYVSENMASASLVGAGELSKASLHFTTVQGNWEQREWRTTGATVKDGKVSAALPQERPLTFYLEVTDELGLRTSTTHVELRSATTAPPTAIPTPKLEEDFYDWHARHAQALWWKDLAQPEIIMLGDSITHVWGGNPPEPTQAFGAASWAGLFGNRRVLNFGFGWDRTQNLLWRLDHGELDGLKPRLVVINIGTNNLAGTEHCREAGAEEIAAGTKAVIQRVKEICPDTKILLMGVFPRGWQPEDPMREKVKGINEQYRKLAGDLQGVTFLDIGEKFLEVDKSISKEMMPDALHPGPRGYEVWAEALAPFLP